MNAREVAPISVAAGDLPADMRRRAVLVLGMHRSGTSALARTLSLLGCDLPATLIPAGRGNEAGHWESRPIALFNDGVLEALGSAWDDWLPVNPRFPDTAQWPRFIEKARVVLRHEFADSPMFVLKDPRICRLLPFWLEVLTSENIDPAIVIPIRNPVEVARSLAARDGFDEYYGLLLWLRHILDAEAASRGQARAFVSYDQLLGDWESVADKIATSTDMVWPRLSPSTAIELEAFLGPDLRHHEINSRGLARRQMLSPWVSDVYAILSDWATNGERQEDRDRLDNIAAAFDAAAPMFARPMVSARETRQKLTQTELERDGLRTERDAVIEQREAATVERDALLRSHGDLAEQRSVIAGKHEQLTLELAAIAAEREALAIERDALLRNCQDLTDQRSAIVSERDQLAAQLTAERDASQAHVAELEREQAQSAEARVVLEHELAVTASTLRQREEEIEQLGAAHASRLEDLIAARAEVAERFDESAKLTAMLAEREAELADLRKALDAARDEIAERFTELSQLTYLLRSSEDIARTRDEDVDWLLKIRTEMDSLPTWWAFASSGSRQRWIEQRFKQRGLFDAEAYRERNKDVADAGMASLRHYLLHGLREGRSR